MIAKIAGLILLIFICTAGCVTSPLPAESGKQANAFGTPSLLSGPDAAVSQKLDEYMTALAGAGRFSGAVHVARGDTVLLSKAYGMAGAGYAAY